MDKYIFLDIDGVIATAKSIDESGMWTFTSGCQDNLECVLNETGAKIVISSSWREHSVEETIQYFKNNGFRFCSEIIGVTIRAYQFVERGIHLSIPRGVEIKQWIDTHIHSVNGKFFNRKIIGKDFTYVILDDSSDMLLEHYNFFVQTNPNEGLNKKNVQQCIEILNFKL